MPDWAQIISDALDILKFDGAVQDTLAELREKWGAQVPTLLDERFDAVGVQGFDDTFDTTVLTFKFYFSNHSFFPPYIIRDVDQYV